MAVSTGPKNCDMFAVFISMMRNCNGFKVKITTYQLKKQIGLVLNKSRQDNILGFDLSVPSDPKSFGISEPEFCKRQVFFFFTTSILAKVKKRIWWSIRIQMDYNRNSAWA